LAATQGITQVTNLHPFTQKCRSGYKRRDHAAAGTSPAIDIRPRLELIC